VTGHRDEAASSGLRRDRALLTAVLLGALGHLALYYPQLPDRVASHFDAVGNPNAWMSRDAFAWTISLTYAFLGGGFLVLARALPLFPDALINLPNKEYWLASSRRADSLARLGRSLVRFGAVNVVLVVVVVHQTIAVALGEAETLRGVLPALGAYGLYTVIWCIALMRAFRLPRAGIDA